MAMGSRSEFDFQQRWVILPHQDVQTTYFFSLNLCLKNTQSYFSGRSGRKVKLITLRHGGLMPCGGSGVSRRPLSGEARAQSWSSSCKIYFV